MRKTLGAALVALLLPARPASAQLTLEISDFLTLPITGQLDGTAQVDGMLARVNAIRQEPAPARRLFIVDENGPIYLLEKDSKTPVVYLDFNGRDQRRGIFHKLLYEAGYSSGVSQIEFDPDYQRNGRFYTVHMETPSLPGSNAPDNASFPGLKLDGFSATAPIATPGPVQFESVLLEWTDTNTANSTFEGTVREVLRLQLNGRIHPIGEITFNPMARRGDTEWGILYMGCGDSGSGESRSEIRPNPQRLDTLVGKILRIIPNLSEHQSTSVVSENGRYRIPDDNPFFTKAGAKKEIWAYGLRNPQRLSWAANPSNAQRPLLLAATVGLRTWESVYIIRKGANYGYSQREGNELLKPDNSTGPLPPVDKIPVQIGTEVTDSVVTPTYPVVQYGHVPGGGDAIGSGFVYAGKAIPALTGKYLFTDLSTGHIWYADYKQMIAADDGNASTLAAMHEIKVRYKGRVYDTMFPITLAAYQARGGKDPDLPGRATVSGAGRADARFAVDAQGELFMYSKTDGMIRRVTGATTSPQIKQK